MSSYKLNMKGSKQERQLLETLRDHKGDSVRAVPNFSNLVGITGAGRAGKQATQIVVLSFLF
jgi:hypothetical protein